MSRWLSIEAGGMRRPVGRLWLPDGLHVWGGSRGVHVWLFGRPHIQFDRLEER